jgi:hypothetical protein
MDAAADQMPNQRRQLFSNFNGGLHGSIDL